MVPGFVLDGRPGPRWLAGNRRLAGTAGSTTGGLAGPRRANQHKGMIGG